ncbi:hypothetical protein JK386_14485 [Nocardioides sp. zg-536]|uniref:Uncharacterized protein n=1 Tax=Nocardioides faecalis TaxID=2803858 RepID=A0A938YBT9_9ACTN|nr:hypothetical protein [Nocardioides faecalis]MBM9461106.1 hypothetical protein [Nocardioides faecalis]MBS4751989.1 hypothetical protein [Nocardioides faecalis]QVI59184.1 hypothetical protein KG111_02025 [Nocardioides faecalis]
MRIARSTAAGIITGIVLLAVVVGFAVGLPEATGGKDLPKLPDRLDSRFVALSAVTPEDGGATSSAGAEQIKAFAASAQASEKKARKRLGELYGEAEVRSYLDLPATVAGNPQARPAQFSVTVVPGDAGLVIPSGPFEIDGAQTGAHYELTEIDGYLCSKLWSDPVDPMTGLPTGLEPSGDSYQVECRAERGGLTYDIYSSGLDPEETAHYLDLVLRRTA